jgi:Flp pilus assembly protein CpaB
MRKPIRRSRGYLASAATLAVVAILTARPGGSNHDSGPSTSVVVATKPIERGAVVEASQVALRPIPKALAPPGSIDDVNAAAGRVALAALAPGEVVTETRLARVRAGPVASLVPRGLRAFAVPMSLPPGAVRLGDHVDVVAAYATDPPRTELVLPEVEVLAVLAPGQIDGGLSLDAIGAGAEVTASLVLLVTPEQEQRLAFAVAFGSLQETIVSSDR